MLFDVVHNAFWHDSWGSRPPDLTEAEAVALRGLTSWPQLVPVYGHRYLPAGRGTYGHPVLSVYQTDVIRYGADLVDYLRQEFGIGSDRSREGVDGTRRAVVPFWRDLVE